MKTSRLAATANPRGAAQPSASAATRPSPSAPRLSHLAAILIVSLFGRTAEAASVNLAWDPNAETNIAGYKLSYGTSPGEYANTLTTGTATLTSVSGLSEGQTYYFSVKAVNTAGLESAPSAEISYQVPVAGTDPTPGTVLSSANWKVIYVSSEETTGENGAAINAIDGNTATFWHSRWYHPGAPPPHDIRIDLGGTQAIQGFRYLPRQDNCLNGTITEYEFYVSLDGISWGAPAASGTLAATSNMKEVKFSSRNARYIWLRALSEASGQGYCSVAELNLLAGDSSTTAPTNQAPVAAGYSVSINEDQAAAITLTASDPDGNPLNYRIVSGPSMGTLSGSAPNLIYTPMADANGPDSFAFVANDGTADSNTATVTITINPVNDAPAAAAQLVAATAGMPVEITLSASDVDGDPLTFSIVGTPAQGSLGGTPPNLTYTPNANAAGADSFSFHANDGMADSNTAIVSISITAATKPANKAPVFQAGLITRADGKTYENYAAESLAGSALDPDGDVVSYTKTAGPDWLAVSPDGKISGTPPAGSEGLNSFTIRAADPAGAFDEAVLEIAVLASELPLPWSLGRIGSVSQDSTAWGDSTSLKIRSSGSLAGPDDGGILTWQTLSGDGEIIARISSTENTASNSQIGLEIRESLASNSKHAFIGTDGNGSLRFIRRTKTGGSTSSSSAGFGTTPNLWLRLSRSGNAITAFSSIDGSRWSRVSKITLSLGTSSYIGLMVSGGANNPSTGVFQNVTVTP